MTNDGSAPDERGSILPMVGGLLLVSVLVVALLADLALLQGTYRRTASSADRIVEAAAAMLDEDRLRGDGSLGLDEGAAVAVAMEVARVEGVAPADVVVEFADATVCVEVHAMHEPFAIRVITPEAVDVRVRACARPAVG